MKPCKKPSRKPSVILQETINKIGHDTLVKNEVLDALDKMVRDGKLEFLDASKCHGLQLWNSMLIKWETPPEDMYKINVDHLSGLVLKLVDGLAVRPSTVGSRARKKSESG
jgi:hypothetical protein